MAASKNRIDWALLLLRLAAGGMALLQGLETLRHAKGAITAANAVHLALVLGEIVCGALVLVGVWMIPAVIGLLAVMGWPLVHGWLHGAPVLGQPSALFRFLATLASGIGGAGKWALGKD
jgi:uncharacterized membrane protein YphA (DoxX/SURF4 family)